MGVVLVLRALGLGDLLTAVPALRALRRALPEADLVLAAPAWLSPLVAGLGCRVHHTPSLPGFQWPGPRPALGVNLHGRGPQSHRALLASGAPRVVAFGCAAAGVAGPPWTADEHEARRWCRLVAASLGVPADPYDGLLPAPAPSDDLAGAVVVHPGAASGARRWPPDRFADLARRLRPRGRVVVTGSPDEVRLAREVAAAAGLPASAVLAGRTSLPELAAVVAHATLVVSGDTGIAHLAAAYDRPAVALFGPTPPEWWAPLWGRTRVLWRGGEPGDPHAARPAPALLRLDLPTVWAAIEATLEQTLEQWEAGRRPGWPLR